MLRPFMNTAARLATQSRISMPVRQGFGQARMWYSCYTSLSGTSTLPQPLPSHLNLNLSKLELPLQASQPEPEALQLPISLPAGSTEATATPLECANRSPLARIPKPANKGARPRCVVMRKLRKRARTGR
eukprot:TRINITY_DN82863_c0_g1_i1.p1 TRINITY_DN82863_c0_g1~~TRINITY_DN82863_c0_g1_i1.p1  ORF type:complete len:130 (+),score=8.49 TRINITY_DN82863_c0_g1_i1:57-446(+)